MKPGTAFVLLLGVYGHQAGTTVYPFAGDDGGRAAAETRFTGRKHVAVTLNPEGGEVFVTPGHVPGPCAEEGIGMKKKIADLWVKALRSGDYQQGRYALRDDSDKFCVLGVLCNLHAQANPEFAAKQKYKRRYGGYTGGLCSEVVEWAGMNSSNGTLPDARVLSHLNDAGLGFDYLANLIEKHWRYL